MLVPFMLTFGFAMQETQVNTSNCKVDINSAPLPEFKTPQVQIKVYQSALKLPWPRTVMHHAASTVQAV